MHLSKLLLPMLLVGYAAAQTCDGIEKSGACCPAACRECGGSGCSDRGDGLTGDDCCTSNILAADVPCGTAPCVVGAAPTPAAPTPTPPTPTPTTPSGSFTCDGVEKGDYCCSDGCGECGGSGCSDRGGGLTGDDCCTSDIEAAGNLCSVTGAAPCIIDGDSAPTPVVAPTPTPPSPTPTGTFSCDGVEKGDYCCSDGCGECGGSGCSDRGGGLTGDDCCTSDIEAAGNLCSVTGAAPCIIDGGSVPSPTPTTTDYVSVGCFEDDRNRMLSGVAQFSSNDFMTTEYCAEACAGSTYFGTQYGYQCFCSEDGDVPDFLGTASNCDVACSGDSSQTCGGNYANSVYQYGTSPSPVTPTPVTPTPITPTPISISPTSPTPSSSPTPVMEIPTTCTSDVRPTFRYAASSGVAGRLYAEGEGCFTITDLYNFRGVENDGSSKGPIYVLDDDGVVAAPTSLTNKWLLAAELYVTGGGIFYCRGSEIGGDCDELRIQSTGANDFHEVRGHGGSMYFESTIVTSWDTPNNKPQEEYESGRSFLNCVSEKLTGEDCDGAAKNEMGECRMDIINSEIAYLGYFDSESYGMTWKVRGFCVDKSNEEVFDTTNVYGDIKGSDIHHLYYGHYTYGHQGGVWDNNKMHDNWQYGFDPHDDSDYLTISNNEVYNNVNHGIIASKRCNNVKIFNNVVRDGGASAAGIFLHRSSDHAEVYNNQIYNMQDAGIAMLESFDALIYDNTIEGAKYGIRMSLGSARNQVYENSFTDITDQALYTYEGSDEPDVEGGRPYDNTLSNNVVRNCPVGVKIKAGDDNILAGNTFINVDTFEFPESTNTLWTGNDIGDGCIEEDDDVDYASGSDTIPIC